MGIGFCRKSVGGRIGSGACVHVIAFGAASAGGSSGLAGAGCRTIDRPAAAEEQAGVVDVPAPANHPQRSSQAGAPPHARVTFTSGRVTPDQATTD